MQSIMVISTKYFLEWLESFKDQQTKERLHAVIDKLENGNFSDHKYVGDGVSGIRLFFGKGYRIYYGKTGNTIVVLLCGGDKDTQHKDIERAKQIWNIAKEEVKNGTHTMA